MGFVRVGVWVGGVGEVGGVGVDVGWGEVVEELGWGAGCVLF